MSAEDDGLTFEQLKAELEEIEAMDDPVPSINLQQTAGRNPAIQELIDLETVGYARDISNRRRNPQSTTDPEVARINAEREKTIAESRQRMEESTHTHQQKMEEIAREDSSIMKGVEAELKKHQIKQLENPPPAEPLQVPASDNDDGKLIAALQTAWEENDKLKRQALESERDLYKKIAEGRVAGGAGPSATIDLPPDVGSMTTEQLQGLLGQTVANLADNLKDNPPEKGEPMPEGILEQYELATKLREKLDARLKEAGIEVKTDPLKDLGDLSNDPYLRYGQAIADIAVNTFSHPKVQRFLQAFFPGEDISTAEVRRRAEGPIPPEEEELYNARRWCRQFKFNPDNVQELDDATIDGLVKVEDITPVMGGLLKKARDILRRHAPPSDTIDAEFTVIDKEDPPKQPDDDEEPAPVQTTPPSPPDDGGEAEAMAEPKIQLKSSEVQPKPIDPEGEFSDLVDPEKKRVPKKEIPPFAGPVPTREELEALTVPQLREYLKLHGLSASGKKESLVKKALKAQPVANPEG